MAHTVIHVLRESLVTDCLPLFISDELNLYFSALTAHFGHCERWVGEGGKCLGGRWRGPDLRPGEEKLPAAQAGARHACDAPRDRGRSHSRLTGIGLLGRLNTAFIERVNLTVRHGVAALARRTWATAQQSPQLLAHLEWWRAYYHFVRPHQSLRVAFAEPRERGGKRLAQRYRQRTPAMAAGKTNRRWTAREVLSCPLPRVCA